MANPIRAQINPDLLIWARKSCRMDIDYAADKLKVTRENLESWESGSKQPTVNQLRNIAKKYRINFGAFFLPSPPQVFTPPVKDYRLHHGAESNDIDPDITIELRMNLQAREIALELENELDESFSRFELECSINDKPEIVATNIRKVLGISFEKQKKFRSSRVAFNEWRNAISSYGVLALQSTHIALRDMRGYSVYFDYMPLIVVNRKDAYAARSFTLLHEFTHLLLRSSGLCDLNSDDSRPVHDQKLEAFCNAVASHVLVPDSLLLSYKQLRGVPSNQWNDEILSPIAKDFGVSREVILRKLLDHGLTTREFYLENRERYTQEAIEYKKRQKGGFVTPSIDVISAKSRQFVSLVFDAMNSNVITRNDASDYLGVRAKHFSAIESMLGSK
ncbi:XRE family transcriptional regulator [Thiohalophilus thiocyanatoxydans]|uniref:Helix-turn-helix protein n=1 Tax=Thiohalophilus thiocyanatoxydans TaxID=381308 RepID=A0A4R8IPX3_9GAMM|nr:XRE family transcriptional regulator [Thiohalophilus thiocyanatoxydans]TDY03002.1 helix-turn-helix protein [Thiohalophilus thiocyanatoxydans]